MKYISLLFTFIIFSLTSKSQWKGKFDTTKVVGLICIDSNCTNAKFFRGYVIDYNPTQKEMKASIQNNSKIEFPEENFLDEKKKVIQIYPITFYYYEWK